MPEGDTVWRTATRLNQALAGMTVVLSDLRFPQVATADLRGATTTEVVSRGKHILHRFDNGVTLHSHLRMEGQWRVERPAEAERWLRRADLRAAVGSSAWSALGLRLGILDLVATVDEPTLVGHLGPDLLGHDWAPDRAIANLRASGVAAPDTTVGEGLLDQRNLAGVGTLWACESLFLCAIGPWTPVATLSDKDLAGLVDLVHRLIDQARQHPVQTSTGIRRRGEETYVHARSGRPCRRCGAGVRVAMIGKPTLERTMFYCPACQGGLGPTDDGRTQRPLGAGGRTTTYRRG